MMKCWSSLEPRSPTNKMAAGFPHYEVCDLAANSRVVEIKSVDVEMQSLQSIKSGLAFLSTQMEDQARENELTLKNTSLSAQVKYLTRKVVTMLDSSFKTQMEDLTKEKVVLTMSRISLLSASIYEISPYVHHNSTSHPSLRLLLGVNRMVQDSPSEGRGLLLDDQGPAHHHCPVDGGHDDPCGGGDCEGVQEEEAYHALQHTVKEGPDAQEEEVEKENKAALLPLAVRTDAALLSCQPRCYLSLSHSISNPKC